MANVTFAVFEVLSEDLVNAHHDFGAHTFKLMLTNTAPDLATDEVAGDITEISAGNGYTAGGAALDSLTISRSGAVTTIDCADEVITASGGSIGPFRYGVIVNDTQSSPVKPLFGRFDYGSSITISAGETFTLAVPSGLYALTS